MLDKVSDSPCILVEVTASKALVRAVEECVMLLGANYFGDGLPLLLSRIDTGGVVCAGMEQENRLLRRIL